MKRLIFKNERGISLFIAIFTLTFILGICLGISHFIIEQTKMVREIGESIKAFYAADAGIEEVLYSNNLPPAEVSINGTSYIITCSFNPINNPGCRNCPGGCSEDPNCFGLNFCLKSIGKAKEASRAIRVDF